MSNESEAKSTKKSRRVDGDRYVLCEFLLRGPVVLESNNDLGELLKQVPEHISGSDKISVCEVIDSVWVLDKHDPTHSEPRRLRTVYEIVNYTDDEDDDE